MSLFAHYPAKPDTVLARSDQLMSGARGVGGIGTSVSGRTSSAAAQSDGQIESPISLVGRPASADADQLSVASLVAGGALGLFSGAIGTYNKGVDDLNRIYEEAKAANFHAEPVADDATGTDGEPLSDDERKSQFDGRVAHAKSALESTLRIREATLMRELDDAADGTAGLLRAEPGSPVYQTVLALFGGSGDGEDSEFEGLSASSTTDDGGGGGLLGDLSSGLSSLGSGLTNFIGGGPGSVVSADLALGRKLGEFAWDRGTTLGEYAWETGTRRITHPAQTIWDIGTGTAFLEDAAAVEGILVEDGELYDQGPFSDEAAILTGVSVPSGSDAITLGHTVRVGDDVPPPDLVAHEMQHVYDLEDTGGTGFYGTYLGEYLGNLLNGDSGDEAYRNISWEERAYDVGDNYPDQQPEGIGGPVSDVIDMVDGLFD